MVQYDTDRLVKEAYNAIKKGRSTEAEKILDKLPKSGYDPYPLFLSALASLMCDHIDNGLSLVKRLRAYYPDYLPGRELDAYIKIKSAGSREDAVVSIIGIIPESSDTGFFNKILRTIRNTPDFQAFQRKFSVKNCVRYSRYYPGSLFSKNDEEDSPSKKTKKEREGTRKIVLVLIVLIVMSCLVLAGIYFIKDLDFFHKEIQGDPIARTELPVERYPLIGQKSIDDQYRYNNENDLRLDYEKSRKYIKDAQYNEALLILNRIIHSNAQPSIRDRVQFLLNYIEKINDRKADTFSCDDIAADPVLYRGVMVKITGTLSNSSIKNGGTSIVIVPDSGKTTLVEVFSNSILNYKTGSRLNVEGIFSQKIGKDSRLYIEARSVEIE
jgi:hypothetical protein